MRAAPRRLAVHATGLLLVIVIASSGCTSHYTSEPFGFTSDGDRVSGVLNLPSREADDEVPLLVFVHGDAAMPADAFGFYPPIWDHLASRGIASVSWDKKGVGDSQGSWLRQSMSDRAREVVDAIDAVTSAHEGRFSSIGLIGFSQAGWVVPQVPLLSSYPDYMIIVSGAINWSRQGDYLTRKRLEGEGLSLPDIDRALERNRTESIDFDGSKTYDDWLEYQRDRERESGNGSNNSGAETLSKQRFEFVTRNHDADVTDALEQVDVPVLALFGEDDLNVDPIESSRTYRDILRPERDPRHRIIVYPDATHSLLTSSRFNTQRPGLWMLLKYAWYGEDAFVPGVLDDIASFTRADRLHPVRNHTTDTRCTARRVATC